MDKYIIDFNTGVKHEIKGDLNDAKIAAYHAIAYTQESIDIINKDGEVITTAKWWGIPVDDDEKNVLCSIGGGHYQRWTDELGE